MIPGIIGKKLGMTQIFREGGKVEAVTVVEAGPCSVVQIKTVAKEGYNAVQLGFGETKRLKSPERGHLRGLGNFKYLREFRVADIGLSLIHISEPTRRYAISYAVFCLKKKKTTSPGRVLKGTRMAGRMGNRRVTVRKLEVLKTDPERNLLLVKGAVPGAKNGLLLITKSAGGSE